MLTCYDVAEYLLAQSNEDSGDWISNLKLQKLVYYAQGIYLAVYGEPLFTEPIEAWTHGPVVSDLYHKYKVHDAKALPAPTDMNFEKYDEKTREILDDVYKVYGQFSAWKLREMTHGEPPWVETYDTKPGAIISHEALKRYFQTQLTD